MHQYPGITYQAPSKAGHATPDPFSRMQQAQTRGVSVTLRPGDLLYIPPYHGHRVEALESTGPSVSLSVISPSEVGLLYKAAVNAGVPFATLSTASERTAGVVLYLSSLLHRLGEQARITSVRAFMHSLVEVHHAPLYGNGGWEMDSGGMLRFVPERPSDGYEVPKPEFCQSRAGFQCVADDVAAMRAVWDAVGERVEGHATKVAGMLTNKKLPADILRVMLGEYVESLVHWAVRDPCDVASALLVCFRDPVPTTQESSPASTDH